MDYIAGIRKVGLVEVRPSAVIVEEQKIILAQSTQSGRTEQRPQVHIQYGLFHFNQRQRRT